MKSSDSNATRSAPRCVAAVLDLPGVVKYVPGDPTGGVALRPALLHERATLRRLAQDVGDGLSEFADGGAIGTVGLAETQPELSHVGGFGSQHVVGDLVAVAAATTGTLSQGGRSAGEHLFENRPGGDDQRYEPLGLRFGQRFQVPFCDLLGDTEVGGRTAPTVLPH